MEEKKRWRRRHKQINVVPFNNREDKVSLLSSTSPPASQNRKLIFAARTGVERVREKERRRVCVIF
jgi:hypothetical protein